MKAGCVLNPATPISVISDIIDSIDILLIMSVNPGFGGQKFIEKTFDRVAEAKALILEKNANTIIQVDGGVGPKNAKQVFEAGANVLVSGSAVFKAPNPTEAIADMLK